MNYSTLALAVLALKQAWANPSKDSNETHPADRRANVFEEEIECVYRETHGMSLPGAEDLPFVNLCEDTSSRIQYKINGDLNHRFGSSLESGASILSLRASELLASNEINITPESSLKLIPDRRHRQLTLTGTKNVLVVRVTDTSGDAPTQSEATLFNDVFDDDNNLYQRYEQCSKGQLLFVPTTGNNVNNGVITVTTSNTLSGATWRECGTWASALISGISYNYVMYVCPTSVDFEGAAAWGNLPGPTSWYRTQYASAPIVQVHEVGHNIGHHHSGVQATYDDGTCHMGNRGNWNDAGSDFCFNGAKTWYNNWFPAHQATVAPASATYDGELVGIADVYTNNIGVSQDLVLQLTGGPETLYIIFNRKKGINGEVPDDANTVHIVQQPGAYSVSRKKDALTNGQVYTYGSWSGGNDLKVEVCSLSTNQTPDVARIIVYVEGVNDISCSANPPVATPTATTPPVATPTATTPPVATPTATTPPVSTPTVAGECNDSTLRAKFKFGNRRLWRNCGYIANNTKRCNNSSRDHCADTCNVCPSCTDSTARFQVIKPSNNKKIRRNCKWVKKNPTNRCNWVGVSDTCRATCGTCT